MKKCIAALAVSASLFFTATASADWTSGTENRFFVSGGEAAARVALSAQQTLKLALSTKDKGRADLYFIYGDTPDEDAFTLALPLALEGSDDAKNALVTVTMVVDTGSGKRFFLVDTGTPSGCVLVSYAKGSYETAFDASELGGDWTSASLEVQKKQLILHLSDADGATEDHVLTYDKKSNTFAADGITVTVE